MTRGTLNATLIILFRVSVRPEFMHLMVIVVPGMETRILLLSICDRIFNRPMVAWLFGRRPPPKKTLPLHLAWLRSSDGVFRILQRQGLGHDAREQLPKVRNPAIVRLVDFLLFLLLQRSSSAKADLVCLAFRLQWSVWQTYPWTGTPKGRSASCRVTFGRLWMSSPF